ncbi:hypothetical protein [Kitasatospora sp. GAS204B]|uniref:hypothetical protein n=1 Tax=unclassified Kitasatospora TaxID=2633591 RepID=UPI00247681E1|nr:hypothetical protein [Kitasatospora sp. GAS204B]MDH6118676.1 hypothetical protein [Kitasatospora sp. GAS204B]
MDTRIRHLLVVLLGGAGLALLPWIVVLALTLRHAAGWVALDLAEAAALLGAAWLLRTDHRLHRPIAALAAVLLLADAGWDIGTAGEPGALLSALAMAAGAELPLAALCVGLALRGLALRGRASAGRPLLSRPALLLAA